MGKYLMEKPDADGPFLLLSCQECGSSDVAYITRMDGSERVLAMCPWCGSRTKWFDCKYDAQGAWNKRREEEEKECGEK